MNPLTGKPAALISATERDRLVDDPLEPWEALGIILYRSLVDEAGNLVCLRHVERSLVLVGRIFDDLAQCAVERLSIYDLTRVLRGLLRDWLSIRNMRGILDRLVRYQPLVTPSRDVRVLTHGVVLPTRDQRLDEPARGAELLAFLRLGLSAEIRAEIGEPSPIPVARLHPGLDSRLVDGVDPLDAAEEEFVRDCALAALDDGVRAIVSSVAARAELRVLLEPALDELPVVAEAELPDEEFEVRVTLPTPS